MTLSPNTRWALLVSDGTVQNYPFLFPVGDVSDVLVQTKDTTGAVLTRGLNADYTVTLSANGGYVTPNSAWPVGSQVLITSQEAPEQSFSILSGQIDRNALEAGLDALGRVVQDLDRKVDLSLKASGFDQTAWQDLPDGADAVIGQSYLAYAGTGQLGWSTPTNIDQTVATWMQNLLSLGFSQAAAQSILGLAPGTNIPSIADYNAHLADTSAHGGSQQVVMLGQPSLLQSDSGSGMSTTTFATQSIAGSTGSDTASHAILRARLQAQGAAAAKTFTLKFITTGDSPTTFQSVFVKTPAIGGSSNTTYWNNVERTVFVELDGLQQFDWLVEITGTPEDTVDDWQVYLEGYIK